MNHETALKLGAVERYVFGGMSNDDAAAFEAHAFDCPDCAKELDLTASFAENARVALGSAVPATAVVETAPLAPARAHAPKTAWHLRWSVVVPYAAAALFGGIALYQGAVVVPSARQMSEPQALNPTILRVVRSASPVVKLETGATNFSLIVDLANPDEFPRYVAKFRSVAGEPTAEIPSNAPTSGTLHLLLPTDRFPDGDYEMILEGLDASAGGAGKLIETYQFRVQR